MAATNDRATFLYDVMPAGCIFGHKGPAAFVEGNDSRISLSTRNRE